MTAQLNRAWDAAEIARYVLNGLLATAVHYGVLTLNLQYVEMPSAGLANLFAAVFGISCSFLGNRYFVFRKHEGSLFGQARSFLLLYGLIACLHGLVLFSWTDVCGFDYRSGFVIATALQVLLSYMGNKQLVFKT